MRRVAGYEKILGKKFGRLTVIGTFCSEKGYRMCRCHCDYGRYLIRGYRRDCGCGCGTDPYKKREGHFIDLSNRKKEKSVWTTRPVTPVYTEPNMEPTWQV